MQYKVRTGADKLLDPDVKKLLVGQKLGVVAAASAVSRDYRYTIDILNENYDVVALYAPEHGPRGVLGPGDKVSGGVDKYTGLPVYSLYSDLLDVGGDNSNEDDLKNTTSLVFDLQDVGSRYFTYASTLFNLMKLCGKINKPLILLDRPNPVGGTVEGSVLDLKYSSYIGLTEVPIRHGMTIGELAGFYNGKYGLNCPLTIINMDGYDRNMFFDDTKLPFVNPSPNLPTLDSVVLYNGTCMLSGTNISEGRGTTTPFETVGAPYIDPFELTEYMESAKLSGVRFSPCFFMPNFSKYKGECVNGVRIHVTDKREVRPVLLGLTLIRGVQQLYPDDFSFRDPSPNGTYHIDLSTGSSQLRTSTASAAELNDEWQKQADAFKTENMKYYLY